MNFKWTKAIREALASWMSGPLVELQAPWRTLCLNCVLRPSSTMHSDTE